MNKTRILLSSVLKPVHDPRMLGKLGFTLASLPDTEVHVAGYPAVENPQKGPVFIHSWKKFRRLSFGRLFAQWQYWQVLKKVKPQIIIAGTFELLPLSLLYKWRYPCVLVYDVRENYSLNLRTQQVYAPLSSKLLAKAVRVIENICGPQIDTFFLAEKSYREELPFIENRFLILENKFQPATDWKAPVIPAGGKSLNKKAVKCLYTGTISELYGIFEAIDLVGLLHQQLPGITLNIVGYWPEPETGEKVKAGIINKPYISLEGGDYLVPHHQIQRAISESDLGLLPYHLHPSLANCTPTKLFEYLSSGLPILCQSNPGWNDLINQVNAGMSIDFQNPPVDLIEKLFTHSFYKGADLKPFFWFNEAEKLLAWARQTISTLPR